MDNHVIHPLDQIEIDLEINLRGPMAKAAIEYAERLKMDPAEMLTEILEHALNDDLVEAIIDQ